VCIADSHPGARNVLVTRVFAHSTVWAGEAPHAGREIRGVDRHAPLVLKTPSCLPTIEQIPEVALAGHHEVMRGEW
jgi:hypothetical protein